MERFLVTAPDGTRVTAWRGGDADGVPVAVSPGLGSPAEVWPALTRPGSGFRIAGIGHRGLLGGERPDDPRAADVEHWVGDLLALMDAQQMERPLLLGWSLGVNAAALLAAQRPDRVAGLLGVCGIPSGTFAHMGDPLGIPRTVRAPFATAVTTGLRLGGPLLDRALPLVPPGPLARALRWARVVGPSAEQEHLAAAVREYLHHDWGWFFTLALAASRQPDVDPAEVTCPVTLLAATSDVLTSGEAVLHAARALPDCRARLMQGTHYLPFERPDLVVEELAALARRAGLAPPRATAGSAGERIDGEAAGDDEGGSVGGRS